MVGSWIHGHGKKTSEIKDCKLFLLRWDQADPMLYACGEPF